MKDSSCDAASALIENFGLFFETEGMPRIAGRMIGYLLVHPGPYTLDELAEALEVSKASISTNARLLESKNVVTRSTKPGDRRDFYSIADDHWLQQFTAIQARFMKMREVMANAYRSLPMDNEFARRRVKAGEKFFEFMMEDFENRKRRCQEYQTTGADEHQRGNGAASTEEQ